MRFGVFGGTFNPVHYGHLRAAEEVREALSLEKVLFIPSGNPPLKASDLEDITHRYAMTSMAVESHDGFEVLDIESGRPGKSYTVLTLEELGRAYPGVALSFIIGIDSFCDLPHWREPERLVSMTDFVIISRPSFLFADLESSPYLETGREALLGLDRGEETAVNARLKGGRAAVLMRITALDISATAIRMLLRQGKGIKYLLPENVESYIMTNGLFTGQG
jgi:nicotinate-nucleotide adenylyltransferase